MRAQLRSNLEPRKVLGTRAVSRARAPPDHLEHFRVSLEPLEIIRRQVCLGVRPGCLERFRLSRGRLSNQDTYNVLRYYTNTSGLSPWAAAWGAHSDRRLTLALWLWHWHWLWLLGIALAGSMPYLLPNHLLTHFIIHHLPGLDRIRPV